VLFHLVLVLLDAFDYAGSHSVSVVIGRNQECSSYEVVRIKVGERYYILPIKA
jgi:hypothetical protein